MAFRNGLLSIKQYFQRLLLKPGVNGTANTTLNDMRTVNEDENKIVWMDMEMTGLDIETSHILEVACLITDKNLNIISNELSIVIHQSDNILDNMNKWCLEYHEKSGLILECKMSSVSVQDAEKELFNFLCNHVPANKCPMAGNTVYIDRMFLNKYMPTAANYIHYRLIDISTIKELAKRWDVALPKMQKSYQHRALPDIKESINELRLYRDSIFVKT